MMTPGALAVARLESSGDPSDLEKTKRSPHLEGPGIEDCTSENQVSIWMSVNALVSHMAEVVKRSFDKAMDEYSSGDGQVPIRVRDYLETKGLTYPRFRLMFAEEANEFLRESVQEGWGRGIRALFKDEALLVFQLPKPLAVYWWKTDSRLVETKDDRSSDWGESGDCARERLLDNIRRMGVSVDGLADGLQRCVIEWGEIYDATMGDFYDELDGFLAESDLQLRRVNPPGVHSPDHYYYAWVSTGDESDPKDKADEGSGGETGDDQDGESPLSPVSLRRLRELAFDN